MVVRFKRHFVTVALIVFLFSVTAELICIGLFPGSFVRWVEQPRRDWLVAAIIIVNLLNATLAGWLSSRMRKTAELWRMSERRRHETAGYLNHHVRNALSVIQYAAYQTKDPIAIGRCNQAVDRIVRALVTAEEGIPEDDEFRTFNMKGQARASGQ